MKYNKGMNRTALKRLAAVLFCMAVLVLLPVLEASAKEGTVTGATVNVRSIAGTSGDVVEKVTKDTVVTIDDETTGTDGKVWAKVTLSSGKTGYIRSDYVKVKETVDTSAKVNTEGITYYQPVSASVNKDQVRVRANSSTSSSIVTAVTKDIVFTVSGTKAGTDGTWYYVSYVVDGTTVTGYVRSDYVILAGELKAVVNEPVDTPDEPVDTPDEPEDTPPVSTDTTKAYDTVQIEGVWYVVDREEGMNYPIEQLIAAAEQNANALEKAQAKLSKQTGTIVVLSIILVLLALVVTVLIFKLKDLLEEDGLDFLSLFLKQDENETKKPSTPANAARKPVARPEGARPANGQPGNRPVARPEGARPANGQPGSRPVARPANGQPGSRPVARPEGARPVNGQPMARPEGARPVSGQPMARPEGARPVNGQPVNRPVGARPVNGQPMARPEGVRPEATRPAQPSVSVDLLSESKNAQSWKAKSIMNDDEEFEFLNWDGEEEN